MVQNTVADLLTGSTRFHHETPLLKALHRLPITFHAQFTMLFLTYKAVYKFGTKVSKGSSFPSCFCVVSEACWSGSSPCSNNDRGLTGGNQGEGLFDGSSLALKCCFFKLGLPGPISGFF